VQPDLQVMDFGWSTGARWLDDSNRTRLRLAVRVNLPGVEIR
jgi:hypothetical protein